jgi:hypothetical protein
MAAGKTRSTKMRASVKVRSAKVRPASNVAATAVPQCKRTSAHRRGTKRCGRGERQYLLSHQSLSFCDFKSPIQNNPRVKRWFPVGEGDDQNDAA